MVIIIYNVINYILIWICFKKIIRVYFKLIRDPAHRKFFLALYYITYKLLLIVMH